MYSDRHAETQAYTVGFLVFMVPQRKPIIHHKLVNGRFGLLSIGQFPKMKVIPLVKIPMKMRSP